MKTITSITVSEADALKAEREFVRMLSGQTEAAKRFKFVRLRVYPDEGFQVTELEYLP